MTEKSSTAGNDGDSPSSLMSGFQKLYKNLFEVRQGMKAESEKLSSETIEDKQKMTSESDEEMKSQEQKYANILEKLQTIEELVSKNQTESVTKATDTVVPTDLSSSLLMSNTTKGAPEIGKSFVLKHVFKNAEKFEIGKWNVSEKEEHFGVNWYICLIQEDDCLQYFLHVDHPEEHWEIKTRYDLKIVAPNRTDLTETMNYCFKKSLAWGSPDFISWKEVEENYLVDGNLTAEIHVKILETKGLRKEKFRSFDESVKEVSDIVLIVKDRKFYVNKTYLAAQSSFFKALLLGNLMSCKKSKFHITGIDAEDFHYFLEVLYGESAIDESNVEGIALLADMYDAPTAIRRCEEFMLKESKKTLKKKLQMSTRYNLKGLKKKCLEEIKTAEDIRSVVSMDIQDMDHSATTELLMKALSLLT